MHRNLLELVSNVYTVLYGVMLLHLYATLLANVSLNIYVHLSNTPSMTLLFNKISYAFPSSLQNLLVFTLTLIPLIAIEILVVLYYGKIYQMLLEALLFFLFTGDLIILIELIILPILITKIILFFVNIENKACNPIASLQCLHLIHLNSLLKILLHTGMTFIGLALEVLLYNFIPLLAILLYITLSLITVFSNSELNTIKSILSSIPPFGIVVAKRKVCGSH